MAISPWSYTCFVFGLTLTSVIIPALDSLAYTERSDCFIEKVQVKESFLEFTLNNDTNSLSINCHLYPDHCIGIIDKSGVLDSPQEFRCWTSERPNCSYPSYAIADDVCKVSAAFPGPETGFVGFMLFCQGLTCLAATKKTPKPSEETTEEET